MANRQFVNQLRVVAGQFCWGIGNVPTHKGNFRSDVHFQWILSQFSKPDLGARQVQQNTHLEIGVDSNLLNLCKHSSVVRLCSMRGIDSKNIHAVNDQLRQNCDIFASGAHRSNNLGSSFAKRITWHFDDSTLKKGETRKRCESRMRRIVTFHIGFGYRSTSICFPGQHGTLAHETATLCKESLCLL